MRLVYVHILIMVVCISPLTEGEDYLQPSRDLLLEPGFQTGCTAVPVIDDDILEHTEVFGISLHLPPNSSKNVALGGIVSAEVAVHDNDGT